MKARFLIVALATLGLIGLSSCGSVDSGSSTHYVPAHNGKGGVQAAW